MTRAASSAPTLVGALRAAGLAGLAIVTFVHPGATRMHAWPWSLALAAAVLAPALALILRAFYREKPLVLPAPAWTGTALAAAGVVLLSALMSPYRGPSLLWSAPLLGGLAFFFVVFDWLHGVGETAAARREKLLGLAAAFLGVAAVISLVLWLDGVIRLGRGLSGGLEARNYYPLGHSNYTAGLALLLLPVAGALAARGSGARRLVALAVAMLALALLFTSGSRGGIVGLATLALAGLFAAPWPTRKKITLAVAALALGAIFAAANPRTRAIFSPADPAAAPNLSNVQRAAMLEAGLRLGADRPLVGWGPGTTPLAYPRVRALLDGGVENALQLHSTPMQLWSELGGAGVLVALALLWLVARSARTEPAAAATLAGYAAFALFDWQLDVPVFAFGVATLGALLASPRAGPSPARAVGAFSLAALAVVAAFSRADPTPEINTRALALTAERTAENDARAVALLRESLALNPDQEIAHSNLAWLLVAADPIAAEQHFRAAARLVPDKGGVYFGLGLACLNQARSDRAARAFALEGLNDPAFFASPYWNDPAIAALRDAAAAHFAALLPLAHARLAPGSWAAAQLDRVAALTPGRVPAGPERAFRRERPGYPVLMRNLNLAVAPDVFVVREIAAAPDAAASSLPPKGWLPSPILVELLAAIVPPIPKS